MARNSYRNVRANTIQVGIRSSLRAEVELILPFPSAVRNPSDWLPITPARLGTLGRRDETRVVGLNIRNNVARQLKLTSPNNTEAHLFRGLSFLFLLF